MKMRERIQELSAGHVRAAAVRGGCGDPRKQEQWGVTDGTDADERRPAQRATSWPVDQVTSTPMEIHKWDSLWVFGANTPRAVIQSCLSLVWMY